MSDIENNLFMQQIDDALKEIAQLKKENQNLRSENKYLKSLLNENETFRQTESLKNKINEVDIDNNLSDQAKVELFRNLFRGREDVYAIRWERQDGSSGYSPACKNQRLPDICFKPKVKCQECPNRVLLSLTDQVIKEHLKGKCTIGIYPLLKDETCWFLAVDFDKKTWQNDSKAFLELCYEMDIPAVLERSRSGNGGHVWIFFNRPIPTVMARKLGRVILNRTQQKNRLFNLNSFDRFFPNQDTLPKGEFGNLIALPLQGIPRKTGNSTFVDSNFHPYQEQWTFLKGIRKISREKIEQIIEENSGENKDAGKMGDWINQEVPWKQPNIKQDITLVENLPSSVQIVIDNLIYVEKKDLHPVLVKKIGGLASFSNPEFYKAQKLRLPTFDKPRVIDCSEDFSNYIDLPRGCFDEMLKVFQEYHIKVEVQDNRNYGDSIDVSFLGSLNPRQKVVFSEIEAHDNGVLSASTAFGKTVVAINLIAHRKINTLILVHRSQLMDQWKEQLSVFLGIPLNSIGEVGNGKDSRNGNIDIAMLQSMVHQNEVKGFVEEYGQIIVDECHHISAYSFEQVLKKARAKYILGLTATPVRKDGHHPIVFMQCGPIRYRDNPRKSAAERPFDHVVIPRHTNFMFSTGIQAQGIQEIYNAITDDEKRNDLIFDDVLIALTEKRTPVIITERTAHVEYLANRFEKFAHNVKVLKGGLGKKKREDLMKELAEIPDEAERLIISTGRFIGEGFDDPRLDTLFLVMPISWQGTLQQYAGRLHRKHHAKKIVQIYDYVDNQIPMLVNMYKKRLKGYKAMGYEISDGKEPIVNRPIQGSLF
ncbi:TOTE conflict system archaeo-eukaryotic primase domain-containing protein [Desulfosporosinus sp. SB140]|uniref:TOTE conflict system archaeo-eukaryotic primase domain-containing protein n=1 Tax=Desulfosporosinus paludis TaxID=3115649 RepID=UPI00388F6758